MQLVNEITWYVNTMFRITLSKPQLSNLNILVHSIILNTWKKSIVKLSNILNIIKTKDQSSLNRFLTTSSWNEKQINNIRIENLQNDNNFKMKWSWYIIWDDSLVVEFWEKMEYVWWYHFDHTDWKYKQWRSIVSALYCEEQWDWIIVYPLDFEIYYKIEDIWEIDFKTKNQIVTDLIDEINENWFKGLNTFEKPIILIDSWYSWADLLTHLDQQWFRFIARGKENRVIKTQIKTEKGMEERNINIMEILKEKPIIKGKIKKFDKDLYFISWEIKEWEGRKESWYVITNIEINEEDLKHWKKVLWYYNKRWKIEVFFKEMKQNFWWKDNSMCKSIWFLNYIYLTFISFTIMMKNKVKQWFKDISCVKDWFIEKIFFWIVNTVSSLTNRWYRKETIFSKIFW